VVAANGEDMGGFQAIGVMRYPGVPGASEAGARDRPLAGVLRGASDHRKDGEAVGW
jgi:hypothetical protein